jgi:hypothetical protein
MNRSNPGEVCRTRSPHESPWHDPILGPLPVKNGPKNGCEAIYIVECD